MLRVTAPVALILLLSGCLATPGPAASVDDLVPTDDDMTVTATRVEPLIHRVDVFGRIEARPCGVGEVRGPEACNGGSLVAAGIAWDVPVRDFADPAALFWRVTLAAAWESSSLVTDLRMTVFTTQSCGIGCLQLRKVAENDSPTSPGFDRLDIYLEEGETGVRVQLEPLGNAETTWNEAAIHYHLHGAVGGYRPVAAPIVLA